VTRDVDVLVIGGGPAGYIAAARLGQLGRKATVIEREYLGGECLNRGCIPSKALIHVSSIYRHLRDHGDEMGLPMADHAFDVVAMQRWKTGVVEKERKGVETILKANGAEWIHGTASFVAPDRALVETEQGKEELRFRAAIVATGGYHVALSGMEPDGIQVLTARDMLDLDHVPPRLLVLGGGVSGVELGEHYARLGSEVTIVEMMPQLLPGVDPDLVREVTRALEALKVRIFTSAKAEGLRKEPSGVTLSIRTQDGSVEVAGDVLFMTVGKRPETRHLNLEAAHVALNVKGFPVVDDRMATSNPNIFVAGDVARPPMLAHKSYREGIVAAEAVAGLSSRWSYQVVPSVIFTVPEVASVGLTMADCEGKGIKAREVRFPYAALGRAHANHEERGFVKLVAEEGTGLVLGVHAVGAECGDFISEAALAIEMGATVRDIAGTIHPHPTYGELMGEVALLWLGEPLHVAVRKGAR
jgi:dihydrolipoamide dehydrogenase